MPTENLFASEGYSTRVLRGGSGQPVLFLHGAAGATWSGFHDRLAESYDVWLTEHPGFGKSPDVPGVDVMKDLAAHYKKVLSQLGLTKAHVIGNSLGGWLASELALIARENYKSLTLLSPVGMFPREGSAASAPSTRESATRSLYFDQSMADRILQNTPTEDEAAIARRNQARTARYGGDSRCNPELGKSLEQLHLPALVIWGENDQVVPAAHAPKWGEVLDAKVEIFPECGHLPHVEKVAETARLILSHLQNV